MATAKKLPSGSWRVRVSTGKKDSNGKYIYKSFTSQTKRQAEAMASLYLYEGKNLQSESVGKVINNYIRLREKTLSASTIRGYNSIYRNMQRKYTFFFNLRADKLETLAFQNLIDNLVDEGKSPRTIVHWYDLIGSSFKEFNYVLPKVTLPKTNIPDFEIPTDEDIRIILKAVANTPLEIPVMLAAFGPLRRSEICGLTYPDDFEGDVIHVHRACIISDSREVIYKNPKSKAGDRRLRMPKIVIDKIKEQGYVTDKKPDYITERFGSLMKKLGMPYHFHLLRHFCCSRLSELGISDAEIMRRGGWESDKIMKKIYRHTLRDRSWIADQKAIDHFNTLF